MRRLIVAAALALVATAAAADSLIVTVPGHRYTFDGGRELIEAVEGGDLIVRIKNWTSVSVRAAAPAPTPVPAPTPTPSAVIQVAPGGLATALAAAREGDVLALAPGVYGDYFRVATPGLTIRAADPANRPVIDGDSVRAAHGKLPEDKALIVKAHTGALTLEHLVLRDAVHGPDGNQACMRGDRAGRWVVRGVTCENAWNGILDAGGDWLIEDSEFRAVGNPANTAGTHGMYFTGSAAQKIELRRVTIRDVRQNTGIQTLNGPKVVVIESGYYEGGRGHVLNFGVCGSVTIRGAVVNRNANPDGNKNAIRAECQATVEATVQNRGGFDKVYLFGAGPAKFTGNTDPWLTLSGGWTR